MYKLRNVRTGECMDMGNFKSEELAEAYASATSVIRYGDHPAIAVVEHSKGEEKLRSIFIYGEKTTIHNE